ncbi:protein kinase C delta type-like [Sardina pilchardus]|uniref:protein kinase C delta type-like n=1 Tax=Sardina pilchardus TaxID=27697 RepID=UPI002E0F4BC5
MEEETPTPNGSSSAARQPEINFIKSHEFLRTSFRTPTFCSVCRNFVWGLTKQGYRCRQCSAAIHTKCTDKVIGRCTEAEDNSGDTVIDRPHHFKVYSYKIPTFCAHCGTLLWGFFKQGCKCQGCALNVHHWCQKKVASLCGVN